MLEFKAGTKINRTSIKIMGAIESFKFLEINTTARPPKSAGNIILNAGSKTGDSSIGVKGTMHITPIMMIMVVTILETAMEIVEITSPSSLVAFTFALSIASMGQGSFKLLMLSEIKELEVTASPSVGKK